MKTIAKLRKAGRKFFHKARRRLKITLGSWLKFRRKRAVPPRAELPRRGRSRQDQITIEVLRYRVDHPEAVVEHAAGETYSDAFKSFLLNRYQRERQKLTRRKFARAAEISVATLRVWLAPLPRPLLAGVEAFEPIAMPSPGLMRRLAGFVAKGASSVGRAAKNFGPWVVEHVRPDPELIIVGNPSYGMFEVRKSQQKFFILGVVLSVLLNFGVMMELFWSTLKESETMRTVTILPYFEPPTTDIEEPRKEMKKAAENIGEAAGGDPNTPANNMVAAPEQEFVAMAGIEIATEVAALAQLAQLDKPSLSGGGTPLGNIVPSSNPLAMPDLNFDNVGPSNNNATNGHDLSGFNLPTGPIGQGYTPGLQPAKVGNGGPGGGTGYSSGHERGTGGERKPVPVRKDQPAVAEKVVVKEKNLDDVDLDKVFRELVDWLETHQSGLSPTVSKYLDYKSGDLTAAVKIATRSGDYELFILCTDKSQNISILLVKAGGKENDATLLRDKAFRRRSYYLSTGIAGRDEDNAVASLSMLETSPTAAETSQFYNIFLSWWDNRNTSQ